MKYLVLFCALLATAPYLYAEAVVTNVWAAQIPGTHQVRIEYDLAALVPCDIQVQFSLNGDETYGPSLSESLIPLEMRKNVTAGNRAAGTQKSITLPVAELVDGVAKIPTLHKTFTKNLRFKVLATEVEPPDLWPGLIAYYPFEGNANDSSGNAHHATANGAINYEAGAVGQAVKLSQSWLQIPNVLNDLQSFTISLWVKQQGYNTSGPGSNDNGSPEDGEAYVWFGDHSGSWAGIASWGGLFSGTTNDNIVIEAGVNLPANSGVYHVGAGSQVKPKSTWQNDWHHYALIYDDLLKKRVFCIDGVVMDESSAEKANYIGQGAIGSHTWNSGTHRSSRLLGLIDEVRIYNRALSFVQIQQIHQFR